MSTPSPAPPGKGNPTPPPAAPDISSARSTGSQGGRSPARPDRQQQQPQQQPEGGGGGFGFGFLSNITNITNITSALGLPAQQTTEVAEGGMNQITGTARYKTIPDLLNAFHAAASAGDLEGYFGCFHPNARFLGTITDENWSMSEYMDFCSPHFNRPNGGWTYLPVTSSRKFNFFPDEATATMVTFDEQLKAPDSPDLSRGTGTAVFSTKTNSWLIFSYHLSVDSSQELERTIAEYEEAKARVEADRKVERANAHRVSKLVMNGQHFT